MLTANEKSVKKEEMLLLIQVKGEKGKKCTIKNDGDYIRNK